MHYQTILVFILMLATLSSNSLVESKCIIKDLENSSLDVKTIIRTMIVGEAYGFTSRSRKTIPGHFRTNFPPF